ncbi:MAG: flagellar biosynthetic protein FliP, partial [Methylococcaceae bacterium]|nr:flagellar biosynthetic protein FliP [Methylococcaceae bacterium]
MNKIVVSLLVGLMPVVSVATPGVDALTVTTNPNGGETYTVTIQILALMTMLTVLPSMLLTMTSFTRIMIVLGLLRQALGT